MDKKVQYLKNGAIIGGILKLLSNGFEQYQRKQKNPELEFDWREFAREGSKGALIGGGIGLGIGAIADEVNEGVKPINTDSYLKNLVDTLMVDRNSRIFKTSEKKCADVIAFLEEKFENELSTIPFIWGSNVKGTAIEGKSDFDVIARFKRNSFSIEEMYNKVFDVLNEYSGDSVRDIRKQEKSIGIKFELYGEEVWIDVVPQRDVDDHPKNSAGYLYVNSESSYTKTDVKLQASEELTLTQKKLVILLKKWKTDKNIPISSYMIELFIRRTYEARKNRIPHKFTDKLLMVVDYIHNNIERARLVSIENTNNMVNDISDADKGTIKSAMKSILDDVSYQKNSVEEIFKI